MKYAVRNFLKSTARKIPQIRRVHDEVLRANQSNVDLRIANERLHIANVAIGKQLIDATANAATLHNSVAELRAQLHKARAELDDLRAGDEPPQGDGEQSSASQNGPGARASSRVTLHGAQEAVKSAALQVAAERGRATLLAADLARLQGQIFALGDTRRRLTAELAQARSDALALGEQLREASAACQEANDTSSGYLVRLRELEQELEVARRLAGEAICLKDDLAAAEMRARAADQAALATAQDIARVRLDAEQELLARQSEIDRLNARLTEIQAREVSAQAQIERLSQELMQVKAENTSLNHNLYNVLPESLARIIGKLTQLEERQFSGGVRGAMAARSDDAVARGLYLDLLENALTGVLIRDKPISPWSENVFSPEIRALGRDWPASAQTMIGQVRMRNLRRALEGVIAEGVPGDFIETGVWRGGACIYARGILAAYGENNRKVWVADSFQGLPPPRPDLYPADQGDIYHTFEPLKISVDEVKENFRAYGLLDENVRFLEGWFKDTLYSGDIGRLAVLRLDGDMYESTFQALDALYRKVSPGGYVIVDDYGLRPCREAVHEFRDRHKIVDAIQEIDGASVFWRKSGVTQKEPAMHGEDAGC